MNEPAATPADRNLADRNRPDLSRRGVLRGAAVGGLTLPLLAACGSETTTGVPATTSGSAAGSPSSSATGGAGGGGGAGRLVATGDVPVGSGTIVGDVVVTQPKEGEFRAFSVTCTHQGCPVDAVEGGDIICPCHGSRFAVADGSPTSGPAEAPLEEIPVAVEGDQVVRG